MRKNAEQVDGWKNWFAWYPVLVRLQGGGAVWIWWEKIQRKSTLNAVGDCLYLCRNLDGSDIKAKPKKFDQLVVNKTGDC